jgi:hypothetical protein
MRRPGVIEGVINVGDRRAEFQTVNAFRQFAVRRDEFAADFTVAHNSTFHYNSACDPSQNGWPSVCLQPHQATVRAAVISVLIGVKAVPLCEPSQNGCILDCPHEHQ